MMAMVFRGSRIPEEFLLLDINGNRSRLTGIRTYRHTRRNLVHNCGKNNELQRANLAFAGRFTASVSVFGHFAGKPKVKPL
jgi:hypothetical protein